MGIIGSHSRRIYFDTNLFICLVEQNGEFAEFLNALVSEIAENEQTVFTSELSLGECLMGAFKAKSEGLEAVYMDLIAPSAMIKPIAITRQIITASARLGADARMKLPDAIHVATAIAAGCEVFLTNDRGIRAPAPLRVLLLCDLAARW